jgi:hypothetical protein
MRLEAPATALPGNASAFIADSLSCEMDDFHNCRRRAAPTVRRISEIVRRGSQRRRGVGRTPHVGTAHIGESLAADGGVIDSDFRNRGEGKPTPSSV